MSLRSLKKLFDPLVNTPLHPQSRLKRSQNELITTLRQISAGALVIDIGCLNKWPKKYLRSGVSYVGVDYLDLVTKGYATVPDVFADAHHLPFEDDSADAILLFDVLEHLEDTTQALSELSRVLKPGGKILIQVPYLYPLHNEPWDFVRLTRHGLIANASRQNPTVLHCIPAGHPLETAALLVNIALSKSVFNWASAKNPLALVGLILPPFVLGANLLARLAALLSRSDDFMPYSYQVTLQKTRSQADDTTPAYPHTFAAQSR